jgi:GT2 family glycosyltransferase
MNCTERREFLIGIVTLNRIDKLAITLRECANRGFQDIVVIDNGSTDGSRDFLSAQPGLHVLFAEKNEGGSGGFNRLMHYFIEKTQHKWLLLFDDDAYPAFDMRLLGERLKSESGGHAPAYTFKVTYPDGTICTMNRPGVNILNTNPLRLMHRDHHVQDFDKACMVDFASFAGILLKRETIEEIGYVSKEFFIYSDDIHYTLGISSRIGKIRYWPEFAFIHDCNRSSRRMINQDSSRMRRDIANKIVLLREYSSYRFAYCGLYVLRQMVLNPKRILGILAAARRGMSVDLERYRNEKLSMGTLESHSAPAAMHGDSPLIAASSQA